MWIEKLLVLLYCAVIVQCYRSSYCDICENHTLCKYPIGGPTTACLDFDREAILLDVDITEILSRINAKRNLVAMGRLKKFPQAANMRKVHWSAELASFAQRWADQCDTSVRPNKEDECRDLVGVEVGQSIAAVVGPAPGLHVKSFIDMWFMLKLHYTGSLVYYNRSRDDKTSYFTQLIWADTEYVGCGRAKFFNQAINTVVERLVCNFAPKGNSQGKPVYTLGYPATQCPKFMKPDSEYPGLCTQDLNTAMETVSDTSAYSLLRILGSANTSETQNLDPNNLKSTSSNSSDIVNSRKQNARNAFLKSHNVGVKRDSFHMQNPLNNPDNFKGHQLTPERGHSRLYHGHASKMEPVQDFQTTQPFPVNFRRFDMTTQSNPLSIQINQEPGISGRRVIGDLNEFVPDGRRNEFVADGRRNYNDNVCTRKPKCGDCCPKPCVTNQCTRGQSHSCNSCGQRPSCDSCAQPPPPPAVPSHDPCVCKSNCPPLSPPACDSCIKCPSCPSHSCSSSQQMFCAKRRAQGDTPGLNKNTQFNYYDLLPNMGLRSGEDKQRKLIDNSETEDDLQYKNRESELSNQVKEIANNLETNLNRPQDSYDIFYSSERKRRDFEDQMTFKPFWQMDEYNQRRPSDLKSLRYTTLADKRNKKHRWSTKTMRLPTESITIKLDEEIVDDVPHRDHVTEKYLSFEELMHLRKLSTLDAIDYDGRRIGDEDYRRQTKKAAVPTKATPKPAGTTKKPVATTKAPVKPAPGTTKPAATTKPAVTTKATVRTTATTKAAVTATTAAPTKPATSEYTANTPYIRMKQCTRKITCTWTAIMMVTGVDGSRITGVEAQGIIVGAEAASRTPPGYVEGCTRTSTCTRDFMDRNKMPASTEDSKGSDGFDGVDGAGGGDNGDEEYCEKRSLSIQRRNLDENDQNSNIEVEEALNDTSSISAISHVINREINSQIISKKDNDCICYDEPSRVKRHEDVSYEKIASNDCINTSKDEKTNNKDEDIINMLKSMTISKSDTHKCPCNSTNTIFNSLLWYKFLKIVFVIFIWIQS